MEPAELRRNETGHARLGASEFERVPVLEHRAAITLGRSERLDPLLGDGRQVAGSK